MGTQEKRAKRSGMVLILCMLFIAVFSSLGLLFARMSVANAQIAQNHHQTNGAMGGAFSAMELGRYVVAKTPTFATGRNTISDVEAGVIWARLSSALSGADIGGLKVAASRTFTDAGGSGQEIVTDWATYGAGAEQLAIRFYRYDSHPTTIKMSAYGRNGAAVRQITMDFEMGKQADVLSYAVASRGRIWLDQNSIVHGPLFSTWNRPDVGPGIETASGTAVLGTINTVISLEDFQASGIQMETLGANDKPMFEFGVPVYDSLGNPVLGSYGPVDDGGYLLDKNLNPVYDKNGQRICRDYNDRIYSTNDAVKGYHKGVDYEVPFRGNMPGMRAEEYDTSDYKLMCSSSIGTHDYTATEYFPHAEGDYTQPRSSGGSYKYSRRVYENKTLSDVRVPQGQHALFRNCTFEGVLFVETRSNYTNNASYTNNIRFENCTFNGVIVTDVPASTNDASWWRRNALTFTGQSTFNNTSSIQEATVLAPNFNVNIGSTAQVGKTSNNIIKGVVIGGIVDVYGDAEIRGTIISMYDTSAFASGYVTNIGDSEDGGSESFGNIVGQVTITPDPELRLPSGITAPIVIQAVKSTYNETPGSQAI
ncbi:MAG: hypothetical protein IH624_12260 [Phycisphaerae bacterium]|nr:hypothetical protein [Phycisphaerae bacterium]